MFFAILIQLASAHKLSFRDYQRQSGSNTERYSTVGSLPGYYDELGDCKCNLCVNQFFQAAWIEPPVPLVAPSCPCPSATMCVTSTFVTSTTRGVQASGRPLIFKGWCGNARSRPILLGSPNVTGAFTALGTGFGPPSVKPSTTATSK